MPELTYKTEDKINKAVQIKCGIFFSTDCH